MSFDLIWISKKTSFCHILHMHGNLKE